MMILSLLFGGPQEAEDTVGIKGVSRSPQAPCRQRIASQKSFFVRCKYLFSSDSVLVAPPRLHLRSSTLEQERNMAYVTEKEEDVP